MLVFKGIFGGSLKITSENSKRFSRRKNSGKEKAHKHQQIIPVTARVAGGVPTGWPGVSRPVARGQKFMCCVRNPRNINIFVRVPGREDRVPAGRIGYPAGRIGDRGDREIVYVPNVYVPFPGP